MYKYAPAGKKHSQTYNAVRRWYATLTPDQKGVINRLVDQLITGVKARRGGVEQFSPTQALEVVGALIRFQLLTGGNPWQKICPNNTSVTAQPIGSASRVVPANMP